jgi:hypothetical protein
LGIPEAFTYKQGPDDGLSILNTSKILMTITISKSSQKFTYTQTFMKIDSVIAYVGGLIGSIISVFFILNSFSGTAYFISSAQKVFRYNQQSEISVKTFNFF